MSEPKAPVGPATPAGNRFVTLLWFDLVRPEDVVEAAFNKVVAQIRAATPAKAVLLGQEAS